MKDCMKVTWTKGITDNDIKEAIASEYRASGALRRRAAEILEEKAYLSYRSRINEASFDNPNWALQQAEACGYARALREVAELMK